MRLCVRLHTELVSTVFQWAKMQLEIGIKCQSIWLEKPVWKYWDCPWQCIWVV